jgi:uncharacterized membrane protein
VTTDQWLLLGHLLSAFTFVSGGVVAGVLQRSAIRRQRPSEVALLLGLIRVAVVLIAVGALATLGFGIALANQLDIDMSTLWLQLAVYLWIASVVLGGVGGRRGRHARVLAQQLAAQGDQPSEELQRAVSDPVSVGLSGLSFVAVVAILVLMVWQPG